MTASVRFATAADDDALRALLRRSVVPGAIRVVFAREPSYASGAGLAGGDEATVVFERQGDLVGMGRCSVHVMHRNGEPCRVGYLSGLRTDVGTRGIGPAMRDGYRMIGDWAASVGADVVFTSIADDNARARRVLEYGGRLGLPAYRPLCSLVTLLAPVARRRASRPAATASVTAGELTAWLARHAPSAHLTLPWTADTWTAVGIHDLTPDDFAIVSEAGRIVAAAGLWDQRAFRQVVVDGIGGALAVMRPALNVVRRFGGRPPLPGPGGVMAQGAMVAPTVEDPRHYPALWQALQELAAARELDWVTVTYDRRDPSAAYVRRLTRARTYSTTLYDVQWSRRPPTAGRWDGRWFRPEAGLL